MPLHRTAYYRQQAHECRMQAEKAKIGEDVKNAWLKLAAQWRDMADEVDREDAERSVFSAKETS
jgi:hypothetical protein